MTDRRAALNEVHQSMHEEYHGTIRREDIIRLAREAGASSLHGGEVALFGGDAIERFAALVAAEKDREIEWLREALRAETARCAKVCEDYARKYEAALRNHYTAGYHHAVLALNDAATDIIKGAAMKEAALRQEQPR